jgi:hypothetical protein
VGQTHHVARQRARPASGEHQAVVGQREQGGLDAARARRPAAAAAVQEAQRVPAARTDSRAGMGGRRAAAATGRSQRAAVMSVSDGHEFINVWDHDKVIEHVGESQSVMAMNSDLRPPSSLSLLM